MRTLALLLVFVSTPALFAQLGTGEVGVCMKIIDYNCPSVDETTCSSSSDCSFNSQSPPVLVCGKESEFRAIDEQPGDTTDPQAWEAGTTKTIQAGDAYCFQVKACAPNCIIVLIDGVEVKRCDSGSGAWNNSGAVYQILEDDGDFCHP